jgi:hypothetical protein
MSIRQVPFPERTTLRKLAVALLAMSLVAGAGCSGTVLGGSGGGGSGGADLIEYVPANQNVVMEFDMAIMQDGTTQDLLAASEDDAASQEDLDESLSEFEAQTGLDPSGFNSLLVYGQTEGMTTSVEDASDENVGIVVDTDWSTEEVMSVIESNDSASLEEQEYAESGVFYQFVGSSTDDGQETYLGVHGDGVFVFGTESQVRNSLDVTYADGEVLGGTLRDAYDNTRDGYMTFAMTMPEDASPGTGMGGSMTQDVEALTGVYYTDGNSVGIEGRIVMASESSAQELSRGMGMLLATYSGDDSLDEGTRQALENLEVSQSGTDVTLTYESDVETLIEASESA